MVLSILKFGQLCLGKGLRGAELTVGWRTGRRSLSEWDSLYSGWGMWILAWFSQTAAIRSFAVPAPALGWDCEPCLGPELEAQHGLVCDTSRGTRLCLGCLAGGGAVVAGGRQVDDLPYKTSLRSAPACKRGGRKECGERKIKPAASCEAAGEKAWLRLRVSCYFWFVPVLES